MSNKQKHRRIEKANYKYSLFGLVLNPPNPPTTFYPHARVFGFKTLLLDADAVRLNQYDVQSILVAERVHHDGVLLFAELLNKILPLNEQLIP